MSARTWYSEAEEDAPWSALNRVCSLSGSGSELVQGEGPVVQVADVSTITAKVFELASRDAAAGAEVTPAPTVTVATSVFDTLRTAGWAEDLVGYNFRHDVGAAFLADPDEWRLIEYKFTLTGGEVILVEWRVFVRAKGT